jgi:O-antigen/teichoic acid export membrane protein
MSDKLPFKRAFSAIGGSAGMALTSLVLAIFLLQKGTIEEYGLFAFLLVTQALANGISNALLGSPLLIALSENTPESRNKISSFIFVNLFISLVFSGVQALIVFSFVDSMPIALVYAVSAFFTTLRWFGRAYLNNSHQHSRVVISDAIYSVVSLIIAVILYISDSVSLYNFGLLTASAALLALPFLGVNYIKMQFFSTLNAGFHGFFEGFQQQGRYALVGVLTTEGTQNSHSYIVTLLLGPAAFAPIAAAALLFRPVMVVLNSLAQIERPRLRGLLIAQRFSEAKASLNRFQKINLVFWFLNSLAAGVLLVFFMDLYWKDFTTQSALIYSTVLISLVRISRSVSSTFNVYLQAADRFKELSWVSVKSSLITIPAVYFLVLFFEPSFSLLGLLLGELLSLIFLMKLCRSIGV